MDYPKFVEIDNKRYKINTDFRVALKCVDVAEDESINDTERALAIIYLLFGDDGLNDYDNYNELLKIGKRYLSCGKEIEENDKEPDMDFNEDWDYIEASFQSDFNIDLSNVEMHWWKFYKLLNGLSNSELGNCCVLNRVRNLRNYDVNEIKDKKLKDQMIEAKKSVALHKKKKKVEPSKAQKESAMKFLAHFRKE